MALGRWGGKKKNTKGRKKKKKKKTIVFNIPLEKTFDWFWLFLKKMK